MSLVTIDMSDADAAMRDLRHAAEQAEPLTGELLDDGVKIARDAYGRQFRSEGAEFGSPWRALAASTRERKEREGFSPRILVATGDLERELTTGGAIQLEGDKVEIASTRAASDGRALVDKHESLGRRIVSADEGGIGRQGAVEIEARAEKMADRLESLAVGQ